MEYMLTEFQTEVGVGEVDDDEGGEDDAVTHGGLLVDPTGLEPPSPERR